jgi:hypothetical protein
MGRHKGRNRFRVDVTLHPSTIKHLKSFGNMSKTIDEAVREFTKKRRKII